MSRYGKSGIRKDSWHHWQDEQLAQVVKEYETRGKTQQEAFELAAPMVGKSVSSCSNRWHTELKDKHWAYEPNKVVPIKQDDDTQVEPDQQEVAETGPDFEYSIEKSDGYFKLAIYANFDDGNRPFIKKMLDLIREQAGG